MKYLLLLLAVGCSFGLLTSCSEDVSKPPSVASSSLVLEGVLLRHPDAHTKNSFFTGNYHLKTADGTLHWLSESDTVTQDDFDKLHETKVRLTGNFEEGGVWDGSDGTQGPSSMGPSSVGLDSVGSNSKPGEPWKWPDHFRVDSFEVLQ